MERWKLCQHVGNHPYFHMNAKELRFYYAYQLGEQKCFGAYTYSFSAECSELSNLTTTGNVPLPRSRVPGGAATPTTASAAGRREAAIQHT